MAETRLSRRPDFPAVVPTVRPPVEGEDGSAAPCLPQADPACVPSPRLPPPRLLHQVLPASWIWTWPSLTFSLWMSSKEASSSPAGWLPRVRGNQASRGIRSRLG